MASILQKPVPPAAGQLSNMPTSQVVDSEVISPTSQVTHLLSDLLMTACDRFLTTSTSTCLEDTT